MADEVLLQDVILLGVGSAGPRVSAAVANGLGLPIEMVVSAIYRAPSRFICGLAAPVAEKAQMLLSELGLRAECVSAGAEVSTPALFDVSARITDYSKFDQAAQCLADFLGCDEDMASEMLLTPPGEILGRVSFETVSALRARLPQGALELVAAEPDVSRYALFAVGLTPKEHSQMIGLLPEDCVIADSRDVVMNLTRDDADRLWRQLLKFKGVRLVNHSFLRYDLVLLGAGPTASAEALERLAGVPADDFARLLPLLPVTLENGITDTEVTSRLASYTDADFEVDARLATFAAATLDILSGPPAALTLLGDTAKRMPARVGPMAADRAALLRARLEAVGAEVLQNGGAT